MQNMKLCKVHESHFIHRKRVHRYFFVLDKHQIYLFMLCFSRVDVYLSRIKESGSIKTSARVWSSQVRGKRLKQLQQEWQDMLSREFMNAFMCWDFKVESREQLTLLFVCLPQICGLLYCLGNYFRSSNSPFASSTQTRNTRCRAKLWSDVIFHRHRDADIFYRQCPMMQIKWPMLGSSMRYFGSGHTRLQAGANVCLQK